MKQMKEMKQNLWSLTDIYYNLTNMHFDFVCFFNQHPQNSTSNVYYLYTEIL